MVSHRAPTWTQLTCNEGDSSSPNGLGGTARSPTRAAPSPGVTTRPDDPADPRGTKKESGRFGRPDSFNRASQPMFACLVGSELIGELHEQQPRKGCVQRIIQVKLDLEAEEVPVIAIHVGDVPRQLVRHRSHRVGAAC